MTPERERLIRELAAAVDHAEAKAAECQRRGEWSDMDEWRDSVRALELASNFVSTSASDHQIMPRLVGRGLSERHNAVHWLEAIALAIACGVR